jgi:hypothetical protein
VHLPSKRTAMAIYCRALNSLAHGKRLGPTAPHPVIHQHSDPPPPHPVPWLKKASHAPAQHSDRDAAACAPSAAARTPSAAARAWSLLRRRPAPLLQRPPRRRLPLPRCVCAPASPAAGRCRPLLPPSTNPTPLLPLLRCVRALLLLLLCIRIRKST